MKALLTKTEAVRRVLRPGRAPTMEELRPKVEAKLKQIVGRQKLYMTLVMMERAGDIGTVGRGKDRRYVLVTGRGDARAGEI